MGDVFSTSDSIENDDKIVDLSDEARKTSPKLDTPSDIIKSMLSTKKVQAQEIKKGEEILRSKNSSSSDFKNLMYTDEFFGMNHEGLMDVGRQLSGVLVNDHKPIEEQKEAFMLRFKNLFRSEMGQLQVFELHAKCTNEGKQTINFNFGFVAAILRGKDKYDVTYAVNQLSLTAFRKANDDDESSVVPLFSNAEQDTLKFGVLTLSALKNFQAYDFLKKIVIVNDEDDEFDI